MISTEHAASCAGVIFRLKSDLGPGTSTDDNAAEADSDRQILVRVSEETV